MNLEVSRWLDSEAYAKQKEVINREVNSILPPTKDHAHPSFRSPNRMYKVNYSEFKQSAIDRGRAYRAKMEHRKLLKANGVNYKKHLNLPQNALVSPIRMTF